MPYIIILTYYWILFFSWNALSKYLKKNFIENFYFYRDITFEKTITVSCIVYSHTTLSLFLNLHTKDVIIIVLWKRTTFECGRWFLKKSVLFPLESIFLAFISRENLNSIYTSKGHFKDFKKREDTLGENSFHVNDTVTH